MSLHFRKGDKKKIIYQFYCEKCHSRAPTGNCEAQAELLADSSCRKETMKDRIEKIAKNKDFRLSNNVDKIIKAKKIMFEDTEWQRCPCDAQNKDRYCGSTLCENDVKESGKCHCGLFLRKN